MGQQRHFDRVRGLVIGQSGVPTAEITLETRLVEDLGMDGDDGHELLETFANEFGVDMSRMASLNYFSDEGAGLPIPSLVPLLSCISSRFRGYVRNAARGRRELTVRNLVASARAQRWITPAHGQLAGPDRLTWLNASLVGLTLLIAAWLGVAALIHLSPPGLLFSAAIGIALLIRLRTDLSVLRRLDAAASFEEQALTATD
jgi:acyl carrier protein